MEYLVLQNSWNENVALEGYQEAVSYILKYLKNLRIRKKISQHWAKQQYKSGGKMV